MELFRSGPWEGPNGWGGCSPQTMLWWHHQIQLKCWKLPKNLWSIVGFRGSSSSSDLPNIFWWNRGLQKELNRNGCPFHWHEESASSCLGKRWRRLSSFQWAFLFWIWIYIAMLTLLPRVKNLKNMKFVNHKKSVNKTPKPASPKWKETLINILLQDQQKCLVLLYCYVGNITLGGMTLFTLKSVVQYK